MFQTKVKLFDYQTTAANKLLQCFNKHNERGVYLCAPTGAGKTFITGALSVEMNMKLFVICPKPALTVWRNFCSEYGIEIVDIVNYRLLQWGRRYVKRPRSGNYKTDVSPYVYKRTKTQYTINIPEKTLIVFDEFHHCNDFGNLNSKIVMKIAENLKSNQKMLLLTATPGTDILDFRTSGRMIGLYSQFTKWGKQYGLKTQFTGRFNVFIRNSSTAQMEKLRRDMIKANKIVYISPEECNNEKGEIEYKLELVDTTKYEIPQQWKDHYSNIRQEYIDAKLNGFPHVAKFKILQASEFKKCEGMYEIGEEYRKKGCSVIYMLSYTASVNRMAELCGTENIYDGKHLTTRKNVLNKFQNNETDVIVCQIQSVCEAVSLHDLNGENPRVVIFTPVDSAYNFIQAIGRTHRVGQKSPTTIVCTLSTKGKERRVYDNVGGKIDNLQMFASSKIEKLFDENLL